MDKDPSGTLKKLSDMGYKYVEHANYHDRKFYGYTPADFKKLLSGLRNGNAKRSCADVAE